MLQPQRTTQARLKELQKRFHFTPSVQSRANTSNINSTTTKSTKRKVSDIIIQDQNGEFSSVKEKHDFNDSSWLAKLVNGIEEDGPISTGPDAENIDRLIEERKTGFTITRNCLEQEPRALMPRKSLANIPNSSQNHSAKKQRTKIDNHTAASQSDHKQQKSKKSLTKQSQKCISEQSQNQNEVKSKLSKYRSSKQLQTKPSKITPKAADTLAKAKDQEEKENENHKNSLINYSSIQEEDRNFQVHRDGEFGEHAFMGERGFYQERIMVDLDEISLKTEGEKDKTPVYSQTRQPQKIGKSPITIQLRPKQRSKSKSSLRERQNQKSKSKEQNCVTAPDSIKQPFIVKKRTQSMKPSDIYRPSKVVKNEKKNSGIIKTNANASTNKIQTIPDRIKHGEMEERQFSSNGDFKPERTKDTKDDCWQDGLISSKEESKNTHREREGDKENEKQIKNIKFTQQIETEPLKKSAIDKNIVIVENPIVIQLEKDQAKFNVEEKDVFSSWNQFLDTFKHQPVVETRVGAIKKNRAKKSVDLQISKIDIKDIMMGSLSQENRIPTFSERPYSQFPISEKVENIRECPLKKNSQSMSSINSPLKKNPIRKQYIEQKSISTVKKGQACYSSTNIHLQCSFENVADEFAKESPKFNYVYTHDKPMQKDKDRSISRLKATANPNTPKNSQKRLSPEELFKKLDEKEQRKIHKMNCAEGRLTEQEKYQIGSIISKIKYMGKLFTLNDFIHEYSKLCANKNQIGSNNENISENVREYQTFQVKDTMGKKVQGEGGIRTNIRVPLKQCQQQDQSYDLTFTPLFPETIYTPTEHLPTRSPYLQKSSTLLMDTDHLNAPTWNQAYRTVEKEKGDIGTIIDHLNSKLSNYIQHNNLQDTFRKFNLEFVQLRRNMHY